MIEDFDPLRAELAFRNLANAAPVIPGHGPPPGSK
jgi:hypothetical protein